MAGIDLGLRGGPTASPEVGRRKLGGVECEHVSLASPIAFDYSWSGETNYLALHDLQLTDGLAFLENREPRRILDLRNKMTFAPRGARIEGWSVLSGTRNSYTALFFQTDLLQTELGRHAPCGPEKPALYFSEPTLLFAMQKLRGALLAPDDAEPTYLETLALVCVLELGRLNRVADYRDQPSQGGLSRRVEVSIRAYIRENLHTSITLEELARVAGLSRFHFIRAFKTSFGTTPHQFLIRQRVTRATELLVHSTLSLLEIAEAAGFTSQPQFTSSFQKATGMPPGKFRQYLK
ncbi:MAG: AraC family transcriptional regulator [Alphaproteobacteria bacterium]|nr:AraC family transcriptional regulator [Alphaproteobacteria bacterium]MBU2143221.1 AraC family transcriptional regulator [Alphaproteobacteria bacterium]MBU2197816.1 AraC family transcriptional regulator [Alphaproteobacteria bacterium]